MPPKAAPVAAGAAPWPRTIQLLPKGRLKALIYHHPIKSMISGSIWCWTYVSQGLAQLGQKEVVFTVKRRVAIEGENQYDQEPLKWFEFLYSLAQERKIVDNFQQTIFQAPSFLGRPDFTMVLYCPLGTLDNVPKSYLPDQGLQVIPLTSTEAEVAKCYGSMRPLAQLGSSERRFPFPPWIDRDRNHCISIADMRGTVRSELSFNSVLEVSVFKRGSDIVVHVPQRAEEFMKETVARLKPSHVLALDSFMYAGADSGMLWKNSDARPRGYSIGTFNACMNLGFIIFCPEQESDGWQQEEDGYVFFLTMPTWMSIRRAIEQSMPVTIPIEGDFRFCLEYSSRQTQGDRTTSACAYACANIQRLPQGSDSPGIDCSSTSPSSKTLPLYIAPIRQFPRDRCMTCSLTRKFEADLPASSGKEAATQTLQSSVTSKAQPMAPATTIEEIQLNADKGCDKCSLLYKGIKSHLTYYGGQETGTIYFSGNKTRLYCTIALKQGWAPVIEFISCKDEPCPWLILEESPGMTLIALSDEQVEHARHWLRECENSHKSCAADHLTPLPTRVLDLGTSTDGTGDLRLYESEGETGAYCALSRCWDSRQSLKTTTATVANHKAGIKFSALPKTFQNAITICRKLKLRYLWIDSLCIIQDDDLDWQKEATRAAEIYGNSRLTIAVSGDGDCTEGCFMSAIPQQQGRKLRWPGVGGEGSYSIYVRPNLQHAPFYDANQTQASFQIMNRAWVHREQLLSPRVLYLSRAELMFKCKETCQCECGYGFTVAQPAASLASSSLQGR